MSANSSKQQHDVEQGKTSPDYVPEQKPQPAKVRQWIRLFTLPLWVFLSFAAASLIIAGILWLIINTTSLLAGVNSVILNTVMAALIYVLSLVIVIGLPWWLRKAKTTRQELGLTRLPSWVDILIAPAGLVIYLLISGILVYAAGKLIPAFQSDEMQSTGFEDISQKYEYILAFITLVIVAPIAEEVLFRGYLYGKLRKAVPMWVAMLATSVLFGAIHGQWNVALDTFALSIMMCSLREVTGSIWAGILLHMLKNGIAFYFLFINTTLLNTMMG